MNKVPRFKVDPTIKIGDPTRYILVDDDQIDYEFEYHKLLVKYCKALEDNKNLHDKIKLLMLGNANPDVMNLINEVFNGKDIEK